MKVEVWSDIVCPWCYIGKRRLEKALAEFEHRDQVEVVWRSFELDPSAPRESSEPLDEALAKKYGVGLEQARAMNDQVTELAAAEGVEFKLDQARRGNTFDAHRLIHIAAEHGIQGQAKERLLTAYFSEGKPIADGQTLIDLATELGLNRQEVESALESGAYAEEVRADEHRAQQLGANGVPFFVVDGRYGVSGAQATEVFRQVLDKAWESARPITMIANDSASGATCDDGGCETGVIEEATTGAGKAP